MLANRLGSRYELALPNTSTNTVDSKANQRIRATTTRTTARKPNVMTNEETLKLALEALEALVFNNPYNGRFGEVITTLKQALAKQEQGEPVYQIKDYDSDKGWQDVEFSKYETAPEAKRIVYTTPQQRKPLTDEQLIDLWPSLIMHQHTYAFAKAIEAAHGIKE